MREGLYKIIAIQSNKPEHQNLTGSMGLSSAKGRLSTFLKQERGGYDGTNRYTSEDHRADGYVLFRVTDGTWFRYQIVPCGVEIHHFTGK